MRFIPTSVHGVLDYVVSAFIIASPWLLGFYRNDAETYVPVALGVMSILYSLFTRYEFGVVRVIPMPTHLFLDLLSGVLLVTSPWLFGFSDFVFVPHVIMGALEIVVTLLSKQHSRSFHPAI